MDVYNLAQQNNPTYLAAQAYYNASLEKYPQARAGLLPTIDANANKSSLDS